MVLTKHQANLLMTVAHYIAEGHHWDARTNRVSLNEVARNFRPGRDWTELLRSMKGPLVLEGDQVGILENAVGWMVTKGPLAIEAGPAFVDVSCIDLTLCARARATPAFGHFGEYLADYMEVQRSGIFLGHPLFKAETE